jgi:hypothetical protein
LAIDQKYVTLVSYPGAPDLWYDVESLLCLDLHRCTNLSSTSPVEIGWLISQFRFAESTVYGKLETADCVAVEDSISVYREWSRVGAAEACVWATREINAIVIVLLRVLFTTLMHTMMPLQSHCSFGQATDIQVNLLLQIACDLKKLRCSFWFSLAIICSQIYIVQDMCMHPMHLVVILL